MVEQYIKMRNTNQYDIVWFYDYFMQESKHKDMDLTKFQLLFSSSNFNEVLNHLDRKFGLVRLHDRNDNFIKIVR